MNYYETDLTTDTTSIANIKSRAEGLGLTFTVDRGAFGLEGDLVTAFWDYEGTALTIVAESVEGAKAFEAMLAGVFRV